jgi:hypothetical protein
MLKNGLKKTKEKLTNLKPHFRSRKDLDGDRYEACDCDKYTGFGQKTSNNNINISASNSLFNIRIDNERKDVKYIKRKGRIEAKSLQK